MLTARSMEKNITISGLTGDDTKESCKNTVVQFLRQKVEIDAQEEEIYVAHRIGQKTQATKRPRTMLVRCKEALENRIFKNVSNLKDKTNEQNDYYFINKQLPEQLAEQNRELRDNVKQQKIKDKELPPKERSKIEVKNKTVFIDGQPCQKLIHPVEINELFPEKLEKDKQDRIKLASSDAILADKSSFQAYALKTGQLHEVRRAYRKIRRMHPGASHAVVAYSLRNSKGFQDDGEYGAGYRLANMLEETYPPNICVFVVRNYGGIHLGPKRFSIMSEVAKEAIDKALAPKPP